MTQQPLLEVKQLKKYFSVKSSKIGGKPGVLRAVDGVSFTLDRGQTLGIVGESGCGKSTLGSTIIRLLDPTEGQILFEGKDLAKMDRKELNRYRADIQMIFQDPFSSLNPRMRVFDIIAEPMRTHHVFQSKRELHAAVLSLMKEVGLNESYANRYPHEFSGGQRQRIGIARALALHPKLIICDEPVSALDVSIQAQILNLLYDLQKKFGLTYIFIAHGLPSVRHISNRIAVMYLGKMVELADKQELFDHPLHPYTQGLLAAIPVPDPDLRDNGERLMHGDIPNALCPPSGCYFHPRCPFATEECRTIQPQWREIGEKHFVACHHPLTQEHAHD